MMSGLSVYYVSRAVLSIAFASLLAITGMQLWLAVLVGIVLFGLFLWAPHSGRYAVHPELGVTALRRDERTQTVNDQAARNGFIVTMMGSGAILLYTRSIGLSDVPSVLIQGILLLGTLTYFLSDWKLRRG